MSNPFGLPEPAESPLFDPASLEDRLAELAPELGEQVQDVLWSLAIYGSLWTERAASHAAALVVNQAVNDAQDMLSDLCRLRGRPATRAARALVEHAVNLHAVLTSGEAADRYYRHRSVGSTVEARAGFGLDRLQGNERRAEVHRLRKLERDGGAALEAAIAKYGRGYLRGWAAANLHDRAEAAGLLDLYDYYRFSSMVLHGAAGGAAGTVSTAQEESVHRVGPSLVLCVTAYHEGIRALDRTVQQLQGVRRDLDVTPLRDALADLLDYWPTYRRAVLAMDHHLWPREAPPHPVTVLCVFRSRETRWYWHDPRFGVMVEAYPPPPGALSPEQARGLPDIIESAYEQMHPDDVCASIAMIGVMVSPRADRPGIPDAALLIPRGSGRILEEPLVLDLS
jgi:hypothetical protein